MSRTTEYSSPFSQADTLGGAAPVGDPVLAVAGDAPAATQQDVLRGLDGKQACPFCGAVGEKSAAPCPRCGMDNTPEARKATKARIGPWYVLQARNPAAPGMRFETLITFVRKGRVRARSVVRGPTTHQLWRFAAHVKGLSREFGLCFSCGSSIETSANICPQCNRLQEPPINPDVLLETEDAPRPAAAGVVTSPAVFRELPDPAEAVGIDAAPAPVVPAPAAAAVPVTLAPVVEARVPAPAPAAEPAPAPKADPIVPRSSTADLVAAPLQATPADVDIIIPALGAFGPDDLDPRAPEPAAAAARAVTAPVAWPAFNPAPTTLPPDPGPVAPPPAAATPFTPRGAAEENPFAIGRKRPNGEASFLSAKDLAAAFQLGFDPSAEMERPGVPDRGPAAGLPPSGLPAATMPRNPLGPHTPPKRRGGFRRFLLFVLTLAAFSLAVLMWVDPAFRQRVVEWCKAVYAQVRSRPADTGERAATPQKDDFEVPMPSSAPTEPRVEQAAAAAPDAPNATPAPGAPDTDRAEAQSSESESTASDDAESDADEPAEAVAAPAAPPPSGRTAPKAGARAPEKSRERAAPAAEADADVEPEPDVDREAGEEAKESEGTEPLAWQELYDKAFDAEDVGDYAKALQIYAEVEKLPRDQWPTSLKNRIRFAKKKLEERAKKQGTSQEDGGS